MKRNWMVVGALAIGSIATVDCMVSENRCDAHQVEIGGDFALCVCEPNAVLNARGAGCTPCGANEIAQSGTRMYQDGFARARADAGCTASSVGAACSASTPCSADFPYCVMPTGSEGYCSTQGCTSDADCAGFEASSCETLSTHQCILKGCAQGTVSCPNEWACS